VGNGLRVAMVVTPLVAMATIAVGLHVGGRWTIHAAVLRAAPHARGSSTYAWQVTTLIDDRGVRETEARKGIAVHARAASGREATWTGDTNDDGVAEVRLDLPGVERGDAVDVDVTVNGVEELARGRLAWDDAAWMNAAPGPFVRASKREGAMGIDVAILGERLVARVPTPLYVRVTSREDGHPIANATVAAEPEPGLEVAAPQATTCANGWARLDASPIMFAAALSLHARTADGRAGEWFGELPVAPGAMNVRIGEAKSGEPIHFDVRAPSERTAYVEVDDDLGRAFAVATMLRASESGALASFDTPSLVPGLAWVVTSSEPRGAETLGGATLARPFLVAGDAMPPGSPNPHDACDVGAYLALHPSGGFRSWVALDGFPAREATNTARRKRGLGIALTSLAVASMLEVLLLIQASRRGQAGMTRARDVANVVIVILLGVLGFGLLGALLLSRA
jgi:hypothetical protein